MTILIFNPILFVLKIDITLQVFLGDFTHPLIFNDSLCYFGPPMIKVFFLSYEESFSQNEEINPSIFLSKFYKFPALLIKFWVERCITVQENNIKIVQSLVPRTIHLVFIALRHSFLIIFNYFNFFHFWTASNC